MRTSTELTPDDSLAKIERVGRYLTLMLNTLLSLFFVGGGYFLARLAWSSESNWTQLQCALFAAALFVCAYECRPRRMGADGQRRITFPLGNPNATPLGALASALFYASCTVMLFSTSVEELSWIWISCAVFTAGLSLGFACQLVYLLRRPQPQTE